MERILNPEIIRATAAELAAMTLPFESHQYIFNTTTGELRKGPGLWAACERMSHPYLRYRASVSQSGTDDPVAAVRENSLGGTVEWSRSSGGQYLATLVNAFPEGKVDVMTNIKLMLNSQECLASGIRNDDDTVSLDVRNSAFDWTDNWTVDIEIRVYP